MAIRGEHGLVIGEPRVSRAPEVVAGAPECHHNRCFRHQLLLPHPYLVLTKPLRLDI